MFKRHTQFWFLGAFVLVLAILSGFTDRKENSQRIDTSTGKRCATCVAYGPSYFISSHKSLK